MNRRGGEQGNLFLNQESFKKIDIFVYLNRVAATLSVEREMELEHDIQIMDPYEEDGKGKDGESKRIRTGVRKEIQEDQDACKQVLVFHDFQVDTENTWNIIDAISDSEVEQQIIGIIYRHAATFRPMIIMMDRPDPASNYPGCYSVYSMEKKPETNEEGAGEVEFYRFDLIEGDRIGERMNELLICIDDHYTECMGPLDSNLIDFVKDQMLHILSGKEMERKIVKPKRRLPEQQHQQEQEQINDDDVDKI